ncbi:RNA-directed DNA polymerase, Non LTR Retrotransposon, partial [Puccinia sorghi]
PGLSLVGLYKPVVTISLHKGMSWAETSCDVSGVLLACFGQLTVAHFVSFSEILKQQSNNKQNTFAIYVDFKKAFDKVPHEGLWAKLRHIGIQNNLVDLINKGYDFSKIQCRLGDQLSDPFTRGIGNRQGCLLSPLLFIIFVND